MTDLLFHNGPIHTLDPKRPRVEALLVRGERIAASGDNSQVRAALNGNYDDVDLKGRALLPGLCDAHIHLLSTGLAQSGVLLDDVPSLEEALHKIAAHAATLAPDAWVRGRGWNHALWNDKWPTAADLDRVTGGRPAILPRKDGHSTWANTRALQLAGIDASTPDPPDGAIGRDEGGQPNGIVFEGASGLLWKVVPDYSPEEKRAALKLIIADCNRAGLTSAHLVEGRDSTALLQELRDAGQLSMRALCSVPHSKLEEAIALGVRAGLGDEWVRIGGLKVFADGALGSQTCLMLAPFENTDSCGLTMMPDEELFADAQRAALNGLPLMVHAIGDRANRMVLDALAQPAVRAARLAMPHRIEHAQHLDAADVARFAELGVVASMQPIHATADEQIAERLLGPRRCALSYAWKPLQESGAVLAFGSDAPVEDFNPWRGIGAAVTRQREDGTPPGGWHPELALSLEETLRAYVVGPAIASGEERIKGALGEGKLADLIVTEADPFEVAPHEMHRLRVLQTVVGGKTVWQAP